MSTHPLQRTCSICAAAFTGFGGNPPLCPSCDTERPQSRCQSCFTPATLYPALNTRICIKCLAIIAKSILDSGLADEIKAQARREQRAVDIENVEKVLARLQKRNPQIPDWFVWLHEIRQEIESDGQ